MTRYEAGVTLEELEKRYILAAIKYFENNKTRTAKALGISVKTLYNKLHQYGFFEQDPTPWCSYGHKTSAQCDCGPIAEND